MMRKALEYCQSPIYGVERALERERSSDRERISERETWEQERVITHTRNPGIDFVYTVRWLHINPCKWRLWLYFYKVETTRLLSKSDSEKAPM